MLSQLCQTIEATSAVLAVSATSTPGFRLESFSATGSRSGAKATETPSRRGLDRFHQIGVTAQDQDGRRRAFFQLPQGL